MHRRPFAGNKQRPLSAIFLGSIDTTSTPPDLPGLPEPPSPSGSSNRSGLPSPPATNSTGSGSVGEDLDTAAEGSLRGKSTSLVSSKLDMLNGAREKFGGRRRSSFDEDEEDANENDEEHTARLSLDNQRSPKMVPSDNASAIKRVVNLAEKNRLVRWEVLRYVRYSDGFFLLLFCSACSISCRRHALLSCCLVLHFTLRLSRILAIGVGQVDRFVSQ